MSNQDVNALGYFFAASPNLPLRQKLALAMMARNKKFPTNLGEGIASVGQEIGDTLAYRSMMDEDRAAQQAAATATVPPIADNAVPPTPSPRAAVIPDNKPDIVPSQPQQANIIRPPTPLPPDQQQDPNSPITRMPARPMRGAAVVPDILPGQPGNTGATTFPPPLQTTPAQRDAAALPPPVVAQGNEDPRRAIGLAMMRQQAGGAPPPAPAEAPPVPPPQAIPAAPPQQPIRAIPPQGPPQPEPIAGYVPPEAETPQGAPTIPPGRREQQLQAFMAANAGNPHMAQSQPARELQVLTAERERQQKEADKLWDAKLTRGTKQTEQRTNALMDQQKRIDDARRAAIELSDLPAKLHQEGLKRQQDLIDAGGGVSGPDPYLGTPRSRQRTGVPKIDPVPQGGIPEIHVKEQMKKIEAERTGLESAKPELKETLDLIGQINAHPSKEASLGTAGGLARLTASGQGFAALHEQLKGKNLAAIYQKIKGTGPVGEREGENLAKAQAALTLAATKEDYDKGLQTFETTLRGAVERAERKMNQPVTAYQKTPDDPYAPDIGQVGTRGGRKVEYIGGDPSKDSSYKTVR